MRSTSRLWALLLAVVLAAGGHGKLLRALPLLEPLSSQVALSGPSDAIAIPAPEIGTAVEDDASVLFSQLAAQSFYFCSGVGGWGTSLDVDSDGNFTGSYYDSDMGDTGTDYPNGTVYICTFQGRFSDVFRCSDWEYVMYVEQLDYDQANRNNVEITNGVRYIYTEPYGIYDAWEMRVYAPGAPTSQLPTGYLEWAAMPHGWGQDIPETLPFWGIYNVAGQAGFCSG